MESLTPLEEMLQDLRCDATFDSVGQFTVSLQKAMQKIRVLALEEPARWLLYAVQAAVGWGVAALELNFRPAGYSLSMEGPPPTLSETELLSPLESAGRSYRDFHNALVWLRALDPKRLDLLYQSPQGGYLLALAEDPPARAPQPASDRVRLTLSVAFADTSAERVAIYANQVATRLSMCPLPVSLDGQKVNSGQFLELENDGCLACRYTLGVAETRSLLAAIHPGRQPALSYLVGDCEYDRGRRGLPAPTVQRLEIGGAWSGPCLVGTQPVPDGLPLAGWEEEGRTFLLCNAARPLVQLPEVLQSHLLGCRAYFQRTREARSTLFVIQRGCRLQGIELPKVPRGWWVALAADSLQTDLSGSNLVADASLEQTLEWVTGQILHIHQRMAG
jgi:hypothetical protein